MWEDPDTSRKIWIKWGIATERHKAQVFTIWQQNEARFKFSKTLYSTSIHLTSYQMLTIWNPIMYYSESRWLTWLTYSMWIKKTLCKVKKKSMRLGKVWYDMFKYIFRFSLKKTRWEVGPRPGYGSNHFIRLGQKDLDWTSDCKKSKVRNRIQNKEKAQVICHDVNHRMFSRFSVSIPVTDLMVGSMSCCCTSSMNTFICSLSGSLYTKNYLKQQQNF